MSGSTICVGWTRDSIRQHAQRRANDTGQAFGIYEHVGLYGQREGDIPARHDLKAVSFDKPDPSDEWALVECVDPEHSFGAKTA